MRNSLGFDGFVMSDWGAVHDVEDYVNAGCDMEQDNLPVKFYTEESLNDVFNARGNLDPINNAVFNTAKAFIKSGLFDDELDDNFMANVTTPENKALA